MIYKKFYFNFLKMNINFYKNKLFNEVLII